MTTGTISETPSAHTVTSARPVNPWAALGALTLWLRSEGILPNGTEWTADSSRRRVALMRELLAEHGIESVTAVERAARHAAAKAVQA